MPKSVVASIARSIVRSLTSDGDPVPPETFRILNEDGSNMLNETGDKTLLENADG
jgi:hypothetical protein